jgi:hypothetical protein
MPITKARLDRMIDMIDSAWIKRRDSKDEPPRNPLDAPRQFHADGAPQKIHGQPDQELWPPRPKPPIPIEHL